MPFHLGPVGVPHASFWTGTENPENDSEAPQAQQDPDSLSVFPHEIETPGTLRADVEALPRQSGATLEPLFATMKARLIALDSDLAELRALSAKIAGEYRRLEFASREAQRYLETRRALQRDEAPLILPTEGVPHQGAYVRTLTRGEQTPVEAVRALTERWVYQVVPQKPVRLRWPRVGMMPWLLDMRRLVGGPIGAAAMVALLGIVTTAILTIPPPEDGQRGAGIPVASDGPLSPASAVSSPIAPATSASVTPVTVKASLVRPPAAAGRPVPFLGTLAVQSEPAGAAVFLNQEYVGETPLQLPRLRAGSHVVWIEGDGYRRWTAGVLVPADKVTFVSASLERNHDR